jgi:hypothetical protein
MFYLEKEEMLFAGILLQEFHNATAWMVLLLWSHWSNTIVMVILEAPLVAACACWFMTAPTVAATTAVVAAAVQPGGSSMVPLALL